MTDTFCETLAICNANADIIESLIDGVGAEVGNCVGIDDDGTALGIIDVTGMGANVVSDKEGFDVIITDGLRLLFKVGLEVGKKEGN